jgi:type I restriction enzyme S subunit
MSEWKIQSLKSLTVKVGSGATPRGGDNSYKDEGISLIRSQNILDFKFTTKGLAFIDEKQAAELNNVEVFSGDILLNITGDSVARCCIVDSNILPARVNQHVAIIRVDAEKADQDFLFYHLQRNKEELLSLSEIGATRRALTKGMIEKLEIPCPSLPEKAIASVLSSLDDKIDLLHRQNKTIEALAETLFRQWFIEPCRDGLPDGWREQ